MPFLEIVYSPTQTCLNFPPFSFFLLPQIPLPHPYCSGPLRMSDHTVMPCKHFYYRTNRFLAM